MATDSAAEIAREIRIAIETQGEPELRRHLKTVAEELKAEAIAMSPYDAEDAPPHYRDTHKVKMRSARGRLPSARLENKHPLANLIEDGTTEAQRPQGGWSEPHYVYARIAARHHGTPDHAGGDDE